MATVAKVTYAHITKNPKVCGGSACIDNTRIRVIDIVQAHREGHTAEQIQDHWARTEMEHAAQRELVGYLVDRLHGKKPAMYEVAVRDIPARSLLSLMRRAHQDELMQMGRAFFIHRMMRGGRTSRRDRRSAVHDLLR